MFSNRIIALLMLSASLNVEAFERKRLNVNDGVHGDESRTLLSLSEFGKESIDLEKLLFEDMRVLQTMSMSAPATAPTSSVSEVPPSSDPIEPDDQAADTDHTPSNPSNPTDNQPEDPNKVPYDINVDMCTDYNDFFAYTEVKKTLQYDYAVEVRDASHVGFASDIASEIKKEIKAQLCGAQRRLNQQNRNLEKLGNLLGYHVKGPEVKPINCPERAGSCFEVIGDIDYGITDTPGKASQEKLKLVVNSVVQDFTDSNVITTFETHVPSITVDKDDKDDKENTNEPNEPSINALNNEDDSSSKNNTGLIAGVVSAAVILIVGVIAAYLYKKNKRNSPENTSVRKDEASIDTDESDEFAISLDEHIAKNTPSTRKGDLSDSSTVKVKNDEKMQEVKLNP